MSIALCTLEILGLLWFAGSIGDIDSGRSIRGQKRRDFVNTIRAVSLVVVFIVGGAIAWLGNRLPHRALAVGAPDQLGRAINLTIWFSVLLTSLLMMATCVGVIVSSG